MAAITVLTQYNNPNENNSYAGKGILSFLVAFIATTLPITLKKAFKQHVCIAQLTAATTINATLTNLNQFDEVVFHFSADGTNRVVTFGTGFVSSGTLTVTASKDATVTAIFDGVNLKVTSREIAA